MHIKNLLVFLLTALTTNLCSQTALDSKTYQSLLKTARQDVPPNAPGIATAIIRNGKVIFEDYSGYADFADSSIISENTRFNIASNGKQFTALAILTLIDQKKISLEDDIRKWLPSLLPKQKEKIAIRHLLNHTSGIRDCYDLWSLMGYTWWEKSYNNNDVRTLLSRQTEHNFKPGSTYLYSNSNYILLALIVEKVSGESFQKFTAAMFQKLNMPSTSFESDHTAIKGPIARAYFNFNTWTTYQWIWNVCGDGNLFTTMKDQIQWEQLIQGKKSSSIKKSILISSQQPIKNSSFPNYGYGLEFGTYKGKRYRFHEGATGAWKATVVRFPDSSLTILTFTNSGKTIPSNQTREMVDIVMNTPQHASSLVTRPQKIGAYVSEEAVLGTYLTESNFAFQFIQKENKIYLRRSGRNDVELEREAANIFHQTYDTAFKQEFTKNNKGEYQVTAYYINHAPYSLKKTEGISNTFDYKKFNGNYTNEETGVLVKINHTAQTQYEVIFGTEEKSEGILISPNKILVNGYLLEFKKDQFLLNGDRIRNVRFKHH